MSRPDAYISTFSASFLAKRRKPRESTPIDLSGNSGNTGRSSWSSLFGPKFKSKDSLIPSADGTTSVASNSNSIADHDIDPKDYASVHSRDFATQQPVLGDYVSNANDKPAEPMRSSDEYIIIDRPKRWPSQDSFTSSNVALYGVHSDQDQVEDESFQKHLAEQAEIIHLRMMTSEIRGNNTLSEYTDECDYKDTGKSNYVQKNQERSDHARRILRQTMSYNSEP